MNAVVYARVSSREQEREGYSIPAQVKLLTQYASRTGIRVEREFLEVESAKVPGRPRFDEMVGFLRSNPHCRVVLVEKTDRLYRNFRDAVTLEDLGVEIHFVKENLVLSKDSKSQAKLFHGIQLVLSKNYADNLREEVKKGMREKAEQGTYPGRAPFGYRNNTATRSIEVEPEKAAIVKRTFELYGTGDHSLSSLRIKLRELGVSISRAYLETILKSRFYLGQFVWQGVQYKGTHLPIIDLGAFERAQAVFQGRSKPKSRKHDFAFGGLLTCAHDGCNVTAEFHKGKYTYYRCSYGRGPCDLPYMPEPKLANQLGEVLRDIHVPDEVVRAIVTSMEQDRSNSEERRQAELQGLRQRLAALRSRMDQMYEDKLDGKISEELWTRKANEYREQELALESALERLSQPVTPERALSAGRILELANKAYSLYLTRNVTERGRLLRMVLLNCATDGTTLWPTYRKPFDLIFQRAQREEWSGREDLNLRPPGPEPGALPG